MSGHQQQTYKIFKYAVEGKNSKIKNILAKDFTIVDQADIGGNTALYYACLNKHRSTAQILLDHNANPNEHCSKGKTPVHAAIISGDTKLLGLLIRYGGDLRLHDDEGRDARDFIMLMDNPDTKRKLLDYLEEIRKFAMLQTNKPQSRLALNDQNPIAVKGGFGTLVKNANDIGVPILVTYINENELVHDSNGITFNNGAFMVYESMIWKNKIKVTIKRLHQPDARIDGAYVDLLIQEQNILSRISFPRIIQMIGISKAPNLENQSLVFESMTHGSLYTIMHENRKSFSLKHIVEILTSICDALIYLHEQKIVHCYVNSHSILLVDNHQPKLANFEYAIETKTSEKHMKKSKVIENIYTNCAYNWLAPEIMAGEFPVEASDMYGFACVIWELFNKEIPHHNIEWDAIKENVLRGNSLYVDMILIPSPFNRICKDGLYTNWVTRMTFEEAKYDIEHFRTLKKRPKKYTPGTKINTDSKTNYFKEKSVSNNSPTNPKNYTSFSEGIASINEAINPQDISNQSSMEEIDKFSNNSSHNSRRSRSKTSVIECGNYEAEFVLKKGPRQLIRCVSNNYERPHRRPMTDYVNKSKNLPKKSIDYHMDSTGLLTVNPNTMKTSTTQTEDQQPPPLPPPLPQATKFSKTLNKPPLNKQSVKNYQAPLPLPPNYTSYLTPNSTPTKETSSNKGAYDQADHNNNFGLQTPKSLLKPAVSSQSLLDELRAKIEEQNLDKSTVAKTEDMLKAWYLRHRAQEKLLADERDHQRQLQQQHLEEQHNRQQSEYQFDSYDNAQHQQVSTPIQNNNLRPGFFDRENPFRKSNNLGENLQKPTPDDKMKYFTKKHAGGVGDIRQGEKIEKKLDLDDDMPSAIESSDTEKEVANEKLKELYTQVKKTTPMRDERASFKERITKFETKEIKAQYEEGNQNINQQQLQQRYSIDNYTRLSSELRCRYLNTKDEFAARQFQGYDNNPIDLPPIKQRQQQLTGVPRRITSMQKEHEPNRYSNRLKSNSLGPSTSHETINQEGFPTGFGSVKNLVESYECIPLKEQVDAHEKIKRIRDERQKEILDTLVLTKQQLSSRRMMEFGGDDQDIYRYDEDEDENEENEENEDDDNEVLSEKDQLEQSILLVEEQEKKANQFLNKGAQQQQQQQQQFMQQQQQYQQQQQQKYQHQQQQQQFQGIQSKENLSTISEKTENSNGMCNPARSQQTITSPSNNGNLITSSKGGQSSVTKPLRCLDANKYMDTSAGGSGDGFSTRNTTAASTPRQTSPPGQNTHTNLASNLNSFSKAPNKFTKNYSNQTNIHRHN